MRELATRLLLLAALLCGSACVTNEDLRNEAVATVARSLSPTNRVLAEHLRTTINPKGHGIVVFVGSDVDCGAEYAWLWLHSDHVYAVNKASNEVTPRWSLLGDATPDEWKGFGFDRVDTMQVIRSQVCEARN